MGRWIPTATAAVLLTIISGLAWANSDRPAPYDLLREPIEFPDATREALLEHLDHWGDPTPIQLYVKNINTAARRGWFTGKADGTFDPWGRMTTEQMVRVINRAFPDGLSRAQFATLLVQGEWSYGSGQGQHYLNGIPMNSFWQVGNWDIRVLDSFNPGSSYPYEFEEGFEWLSGRGYESLDPSALPDGTVYALLDVEVVYRGTRPRPQQVDPSCRTRCEMAVPPVSFDLPTMVYSTWEGAIYKPPTEDGACDDIGKTAPDNLYQAAADVEPGVPVRGWLCSIIYERGIGIYYLSLLVHDLIRTPRPWYVSDDFADRWAWFDA